MYRERTIKRRRRFVTDHDRDVSAATRLRFRESQQRHDFFEPSSFDNLRRIRESELPVEALAIAKHDF
jgi:hypothetical protein